MRILKIPTDAIFASEEVVMSLNETPSANRIHISFFGMRNAGKSSLVNAVTGQSLSIVSPIAGTTTDPVKKAMELLPLGPVVITDTPGLDDEGDLGNLRVKKAKETLAFTDIAILAVDAQKGLSELDKMLAASFKEKKIPYLTVFTKADLVKNRPNDANSIYVSSKTGKGINELKEKIASLSSEKADTKKIVSDLLSENDIAVLVVPIDSSAPKGRLILPQQQTIRDLLDGNCITVVCKETCLAKTLASLGKKPKIVITDSQVFDYVSKITPSDVYLTSFSILFARFKGDLPALVKGAKTLEHMNDGDKILISEGCTHHRQCEDIGTVKIPSWIEKFTGKKFDFSFTSGGEFPDNLSDYSLVVHCGGCMLNEKEMKSRIARAEAEGVPIVNYGVLIAHMHGILERSLEPFKGELT